MIKTMKIGSNFIVVLLVQSLLLAPGAYSLGEHSPEANTLSPAIAVNSPDFIKAIVDARVSRRTPDKFSAELSPEERRAFGEEIGNICAFNHKEWVELRNSDIPSRILTRFNKLKKERKETSGTVLGFMLAELGFGENIPLWKAEGDYDKAVRVMRDKIIPFLQKYEFDPVTGQFENRSETCSEEKLVRQGDLYYSRFVETAFSDAVYKKLSVKTGGIANTVCGNAWKFGELIEAATERRVLAGQVVRAYYQRQILPMLEEIYKYTPFLLRQRMQQETRTRLSRAVYFYETSRTASVFSLDEQDIGDIVFVHKILKAKLPSRDFIDRVRNILDLRDWLRKTEKLSEPDQTLLSALDKYWPSGQVDGTLISRTIGKDSADISAFHEVFVEPVRGFLNSRLWRWRGRLESGQRDYWTLLRRSPGWFSLLGAADFLKKENYGRTEDQTGPVTLVDLDAFYSSLFGAIREKEGRIPEGVRIIDAVTDPLAAQFGANPDKEDISFTADWPFAPESIDVMVSGFNLYRLNSQELLDRFVRVNAGLKTAGKFIVTVPANLYIPDQGIELLGELGFELKLERVATEELKSSEKHRLGEEGDAVAAGISKRQFYLMVFEKTGNADPDAIKAISPAELQRFGFVEAPAVKESRKLTPSQLPREENGLTVSREEKIAIEDIAAEHLKLNYITDGWLGKKRAAVNVTHFKTMLENINMVQEVLLDTLARMEEPGNEEAKELFDMLANILEHYDEISRFSETELQGIDFSQQEAVTALDRLAKQ
ncbi:MAG: hypothetical protein PHO30_07375, partial [Candidatus Omnitrophica bacterium]|nr:hypothetical protein [Candidatus Omnitrophota bacterium]